ncbi:MAG: hypothetical protein APF81_24530 [Desulfosporosinus sp. BRH_c37]|nr:MAG: hypothetical protein APF81_24530 [Desulfosporosinus sp. BRH_c37]
MKKVRIASGSSYWGDMLEPAIEVAEKGDVKYIGFDHLAELTMAIMQRMKAKDPTKGYIPDLIPWMDALLPICHPKGIKLITNAGGVNPEAAAEEVIKIARAHNITNLKIGVISETDMFEKMKELRAKGMEFPNLDTGEKDIESIESKIMAANAYIGADMIIEALKNGADVVIAGRVSDTALYVGPLMYEFGWEFKEPYWDRIGAAVTIGHLIECAENVTGGLSGQWDKVKNMAQIGYPIAEVSENGDVLLSKVAGSGGILNQWTVKEQLTYEVHDPANYIMPDGIADFTTVKVQEVGEDQVRVTGMTGKPRPEKLKVQVGYKDGFISEGLILLPWPDAYAKAKQAEQTARKRFEIVGLKARELRFDYVGINTLHGELAPEPNYEPNEVGLRIVARTDSLEEAGKVGREATHLWTLGGTGSSYGTPYRPRPVISLWPTLVPRDEVPLKLTMKEV